MKKAVAETLHAVRLHRQLGVAEVARAMRMPVRSYHSLQAGRSRPHLDLLLAFAHATDSDPFAVIAAVCLRAPMLAVHCADNKLALIMLYTLVDFQRTDVDAMQSLQPANIISALRGAFDRLADDVHGRAAAEAWLKAQVEQLRTANIDTGGGPDEIL